MSQIENIAAELSLWANESEVLYSKTNDLVFRNISQHLNLLSAYTYRLLDEPSGGVSSFNTRIGDVVLLSSDVTTALTYTPVTEARTLTINGVTYDLSANRSWTISTATPTLAQVTTAGNTTTNAITVGGATVNGNLTATKYYTIGASAGYHFMELISSTTTNAYVNFRRDAGANGVYAYQLNNGSGYFSTNANTGETSLFAASGGFFLNFYSGGIESMRIFSSTRNVVIQNGGTFTDAGYKLDVNGTARVQTSAYFATVSGNVGIGTTSPTNKLHIVSDAYNTGNPTIATLKVVADTSTIKYPVIMEIAASTGGNMTFLGTASAGFLPSINFTSTIAGLGGSFTGITPTDSQYIGGMGVFGIDGRLSGGPLSVANIFSVASFGNMKMVIAASGNIGIGTISPTYKLDVQGTTATSGISTDIGLNLNPVTNPSTGSVSLVASAGNVDLGIHYYWVSYTTAIGETGTYNIGNVTTVSGSQQVLLTIPVSSDYRVTGRKLHRTKANGFSYETYVITTIANNTATTYTDNIADSALTGVLSAGYYQINTTNQGISVSASNVMRIDRFATHFGINAGGSINGGGNNTLIGYNAGRFISTGNQNVGVGTVLGALTTGGNNVAMGPSAAASITVGADNIMIGRNAAVNINGNSNQNTIIGSFAWNAGTPSAKQNNTGLGYYVGSTNTGNNNLFLGNFAGYYVTGSNNILLDTILRADEATSKSSALIYGVTNATASSQTLSLGGGGNVMIGTITNAGYRLDVNGTARFQGFTTVSATTLVNGDAGLTVQSTTNNSVVGQLYGIHNIVTASTNVSNIAGINSAVNTSSSASLMAAVQGQVNISANTLTEGKGFTTNPAATGTGTFTRYIGFDNLAVFTAGSGSVGTQIFLRSQYLNVAANNIGLLLQDAAASTVTGNWAIHDQTGYASYFKGSIGIGTTSPAYRVDVQGTTLATSTISAQGAFNIARVPAPTGTITLTPSAGGSVDVGQHHYFVTYTTAIGETERALTTTITIVSGSQTVTITGIPVSTDPRVTGRKIYRTRAGQTSDRGMVIATIADNTTTSYVDTAADSTFPNLGDWGAYRDNTTSRQITIDGTKAMALGTGVTAIGFGAGASVTTAGLTTLVGYNAGNALTYGFQNTLVGTLAGRFVNTGSGNTALGSYCLMGVTTGGDNISIGQGSSWHNATGSNNIAVGSGALYGQSGVSHSGNIGIGASALTNLGAANNNLAIGYYAGRYISSGSNNTLSSNSIFIGYDARPNADSEANQIVIGYNGRGLGSNTTILGNSSTTFTSIPAGNMTVGGTTNAGYKLDVVGTTRIQGTTTITPAADTSALVSTGYSVTGSGTTPLIDLSGTWNTTGAPTLIKANVTNTASNAGSMLIDLQVGGSSRFSVRNDGVVSVSNEVRNGSMTQTTSGLRFGSPAGYMQLGGSSGSGNFANSSGAEIDLYGWNAGINAGSIIFRTGVSSTSNQVEVARITSLGNILIGTTTDAGFKLDVNGTINATAYRVGGVAGWSGNINIPTMPPIVITVTNGIITNVF